MPWALPVAPTSARYVTGELGFDACIDYREHPDARSLSQALKAACPQGHRRAFRERRGLILDAVLSRANAFSRVALCGMIAGYDGQPIPLAAPQLILVNRMRIEGFIVSEHMEVWPQALKELGTLVATSRLKVPRDHCSRPLRRAGSLHRPAQGPQLRQATRPAARMKTAVITGAGSGFGLEVARLAARAV